jgi:hypothetical protein
MPKAFLVGSEVAKRKLESLGYQPSIADANIGPQGNVQSLPLMHIFCICYIHEVNCKQKIFPVFEGLPSHLNYVMWNLEAWGAT